MKSCSLCLCLCVRGGKKSETADCLSESSLFINSWVIFYAFGDNV